MLLAVERAYPQSLDAAQRLIRLQLAHVGAGVQVHIGRADHRGAIARAEPRGRAELPHFRPHHARIEGQRDQGGIAPLPIAGPVLVRSQLEERLRARCRSEGFERRCAWRDVGGGQSERREKRALWRASVTETTHPCSTIVRPIAKSCSTRPAMDEGHGRAARMAVYSACTSFSLGTSARYRSPILRTACGPIRERRSGCANVSRSNAAWALAPRALPVRPASALAALTPRNRRRFMLTSGTRPC